MLPFSKGKYRVRLAETAADQESAQRLRHLAFVDEQGAKSDQLGLDRDGYDDFSTHFLIENRKSGKLVCCFRIMRFGSGAEISKSYSAQFYELSALETYAAPMVELGRFCVHPDENDPDLLRVAWAAITKYVDNNGVELLFGCSSFRGTNADNYSDVFTILRDNHLAPSRWLPRVKAPKVFNFSNLLGRSGDAKKGMQLMPPLLKSYLMMGGVVSDHAVIDRRMNTLHVFTGVEIRTIPAARKRLLRALSAGAA
jgi:L-ornithine Nalpha-acyltransferase